jgi:peptidoglycan/LPS O-acetylase OafA/YrhL
MKRLDQLNFLRFLTALVIVLFHYGKSAPPFTTDPWKRIPPIGPDVVAFFFVLSGFILAYVYKPNREGKIPWKSFILKRLTRIYPLYLVAILAMIPFRWGDTPHTLTGLVLDLTLLQAWVPPYPLAFNGPAWAMSIIFVFYVLFPVLYPWMLKKGIRFSIWFAGIFWLVSQIASIWLFNSWYAGAKTFSHDFLSYNPIFHLNAFLVGMAGSMLFKARQPNVREDKDHSSDLLLAPLLLFLGFVFFRGNLQEVIPFKLLYSNGLLAPLFLWIIYLIAQDTSWMSKFLSSKWLLLFGEISFTVYLLQSPMVQIYQTYLLDRIEHRFPWMQDYHFYLYLLMLIAAAFLVQRLYELPMQKYLRRKLVK